MDEYGITPPCSAKPVATAAMACSRTPKWMFLPEWFQHEPTEPWTPSLQVAGFWKSPQSFIQVRVEGLRSAEPPMRDGTVPDTSWSTASHAFLVETGFPPTKRSDSPASQPLGSSPAILSLNSSACSGYDLL